ncbi:AGE family epimerase/isomerase [Ketogulonicigenium vulgare]|uniref:Mannose-6-phosphate isomerase-like protein n=1 Tax=Ketogulonicigenium vulgare (strain WSH-001) TaxID=759362 RepID=F9Y878_KETVW|nr:AGE family epimerase/isomerase [Ketogulonicigenium vulgare]ADO41514.1 mannose-6-phosphate isomerase [Ketogulonicigenium vulgare Y25]AEM42364.1 Mannose-6-phosphate isomerase-like protein [Ketogulonicigenium vulgare WSH-001]ALJ79988.1 mannose-6-phosphate isomerase [Ketogulonicigenium vulgare]AOZ53448.1 mannose-6-phosphate isomerase [Ketogulonicigenium vulgare]
MTAFDFTHWLSARALPLWRARGFCPQGFGAIEHLDADGQPALDQPRRNRIHTRQAFVFAGAARDLHSDDLPRAQRLLGFARSLIGPGGWLPTTSDAAGQPAGDAHRLYDLAFYILANAELPAPVIPWDFLLDALARLKADRGWWDDRYHSLPRTQNAHMHLFEAAHAAHAATGDPAWAAVIDECRALFADVFFQSDGTIFEFFDADWQPLQTGQQVEPGHGMEWVYLAYSDPVLRDQVDLDLMFNTAAAAMTPDGFLPDSTLPPSATCRLWPQTELLRAALVQQYRGRALPAPLQPTAILDRFAARYLTAEGGWIDACDRAGVIVADHMPSSSFYHIFSAWRAFSALSVDAARLGSTDRQS